MVLGRAKREKPGREPEKTTTAVPRLHGTDLRSFEVQKRLPELSRAGTPERELLADDRRVKFTIQELPDDGVFITAQIEGNKVFYSIVLTKGKNPLTRGDVERHFEATLSIKLATHQYATPPCYNL